MSNKLRSAQGAAARAQRAVEKALDARVLAQSRLSASEGRLARAYADQRAAAERLRQAEADEKPKP
jgi:hypothetical protein